MKFPSPRCRLQKTGHECGLDKSPARQRHTAQTEMRAHGPVIHPHPPRATQTQTQTQTRCSQLRKLLPNATHQKFPTRRTLSSASRTFQVWFARLSVSYCRYKVSSSSGKGSFPSLQEFGEPTKAQKFVLGHFTTGFYSLSVAFIQLPRVSVYRQVWNENAFSS